MDNPRSDVQLSGPAGWPALARAYDEYDRATTQLAWSKMHELGFCVREPGSPRRFARFAPPAEGTCPYCQEDLAEEAMQRPELVRLVKKLARKLENLRARSGLYEEDLQLSLMEEL